MESLKRSELAAAPLLRGQLVRAHALAVAQRLLTSTTIPTSVILSAYLDDILSEL
jgi:hypothetical protein